MRSSAIIRIVVWGLVAFVLLALLVGGISSGWRFNFFGNIGNNAFTGFDYSDSAHYTIGGGQVDAAQIRNIDVHWIDGNIEILPGGEGTIAFSEASAYQLDDDYKMRYYVQGDTLHIQYSAPRVRLRRLPQKTLTLTIPATLALQNLDVEAVSAKLDITGVAANELDIQAVSGSLNISDITSDAIDIEAVSGRMQFENMAAKTISITGVSGNIQLEKSDVQDLRCEMVSGALTLQPGANLQKLRVETVSGNITLLLPSEFPGFRARYSETNVRFNCDFPVTMESKRVAVYNGGGADMAFESVSGSVNIEMD